MMAMSAVARQTPPRVALYLDHGCRGAGTIAWAQLLSRASDLEFSTIWRRMQAGADASDPELARAYSGYLYMANLGDIFSRWGDDEMRGDNLYVLMKLGIFKNLLTREEGVVKPWPMTEKQKAEVEARMRFVGLAASRSKLGFQN